jgi:hypothetical protein
MLPRLEIHTLEINKVSEGAYTINLVVDNAGFLPTYSSKQGKKRGVMREVRVVLDLPDGVEILNGKQKEKMGHLEGRSNKIGATFGYASPTDNRARLEWTLKAKDGDKVTIHIRSERAGTIHKEITLT